MADDRGTGHGSMLTRRGLRSGPSRNEAEGTGHLGECRPQPIEERFAPLRRHPSGGAPRGSRTLGLPRNLRERAGRGDGGPRGRGRFLRGLFRSGGVRRLLGVDRRDLADEPGVLGGRRVGGDGGRFRWRHHSRFVHFRQLIDGDGGGPTGRKLHDDGAGRPLPNLSRRILERRDQSLVGGELLLRGDADRTIGSLDPFGERPPTGRCRGGPRLADDRIGLFPAGLECTERGKRREQPDE